MNVISDLETNVGLVDLCSERQLPIYLLGGEGEEAQGSGLTIPGPAGAAGATGATGATGAAGATGSQGPPGPATVFGNLLASTVSLSTTNYFGPGDTTTTATETNARTAIQFAATVSNFYLRTSSSQPATGSLVFTVLKNGSATAITFTIGASAGAALYSDTTHSFTVAAGDEISIQVVNNGLVASAAIQGWSLELSGSGGGGGGDLTAAYVITAADAMLTNAKILPELANYNPDKPPASPQTTNDEFQAGSISGSWTTIGSPTTLNASTYFGYALIADASGSQVGMYEAFAPGGAWTVAAKVSVALGANFAYAGFVAATSGGVAIATIAYQNDNGSPAILSNSGNTILAGTPYSGTVYMALQCDGATNYKALVSSDGIAWIVVQTFTAVGTVARLQLVINGVSGSGVSAAYDFVRTFASQTTVIGAAP
jgi:hypothetical protein